SKGLINQSGYEATVRNGEMKLCVLAVGKVGIAGAVGYKEASGAGQDEVAAAGGLVGLGCSSKLQGLSY
ncbi:hypothetical protein MKW98_009274, partial [Papaver atlanticum]